MDYAKLQQDDLRKREGGEFGGDEQERDRARQGAL